MNKIYQSILVFVVISISVANGLYGQTSKPADTTVHTGHRETVGAAVKESTDIILGSFTKQGNPAPESSGVDFYDKAEIQIAGAIKGTLSGDLKVCYPVQSKPGKEQEAPPAIGVQYIMFMRKLNATYCEIKKLLPATDANVASVKAVLGGQAKN